ncbi:retron system putative HNH endonuclease [Pseudomonas sp. 2FE]|uniref:retron system putative HNH endonuclease n=1 Tax=Pseudomonas sp. 2FE TaxID=2502190 RepID=UPI0010F9A811|nr:retron system putative HNH endonuclease [Pseudomonas sp. 2FE]
MRSISKVGDGGYHLNRAHNNPPATSQQATSRWSSFGHKDEVLRFLLDEQYHLCCYSELRADEEGFGYHIEHVENKSQNPPRTFDYSNLAASALDIVNGLQTLKVQGHAAFGGHAPGKQQGCDINLFVSCHQPDTASFFAYLSDGRIVPSPVSGAHERGCAQHTIDTLNLNSPYLITRRRQWWDEMDELFQEHEAKGWSLESWAVIELVPINNRLQRFFSLTRQLFGQIAETTLQEHSPELV